MFAGSTHLWTRDCEAPRSRLVSPSVSPGGKVNKSLASAGILRHVLGEGGHTCAGPLRRAPCKAYRATRMAKQSEGVALASWEGTMTNNIAASVQNEARFFAIAGCQRPEGRAASSIRSTPPHEAHKIVTKSGKKEDTLKVHRPLPHRLNELEHNRGEEFRIEFQDTRSPLPRVKECLAGFEEKVIQKIHGSHLFLRRPKRWCLY